MAFSMMTRSALPLHLQTSEWMLWPPASRVIARFGYRTMPLLHSFSGGQVARGSSTACSRGCYPRIERRAYPERSTETHAHRRGLDDVPTAHCIGESHL